MKTYRIKYKTLIIIIAVIAAVGIAGSVIVMNAPAKNTARVSSSGEIVRTIDLSTAEDEIFDVEYRGHINTVEIKDHQIRVLEADCPDQTCVRMGWLRSASMPIVCLPHHLVIEFTDSADGIDAVTR